MLGTSICPNCNASFTITDAQLDALQGLVRCGRCMELFDFRISYVANHPDPQLELPISDEHHQDFATDDDRITEVLAAARQREIFGDHEDAETYTSDDTQAHEPFLADDTDEIKTLIPLEHDDIETLSPLEETQPEELDTDTLDTDAFAVKLEEIEAQDYAFEKKAHHFWPWAAASGALLLVLLLQAAYQFRVELAAHFPAVKPVLFSTCEVLECEVNLPRNANLMSIESSSLADIPQKKVVLNALLRNHASYAQAFPELELTLTDAQDEPQARRTFKPVDYLPPNENEIIGLLSNRELNIKLYLDTQNIRPSGYRLMLLYPQ
jgi:predicted Zn finger-like uncharacterized protein